MDGRWCVPRLISDILKAASNSSMETSRTRALARQYPAEIEHMEVSMSHGKLEDGDLQW